MSSNGDTVSRRGKIGFPRPSVTEADCTMNSSSSLASSNCPASLPPAAATMASCTGLTSPLTKVSDAPVILGNVRLVKTQVGCVYGHAAPICAPTVCEFRTIHSYVDDPMASAPTSLMKVG